MDSIGIGQVVDAATEILKFANGGHITWAVGAFVALIVLILVLRVRKLQKDTAARETEQRKNDAIAENPGVNQGSQDNWDKAQKEIDDTRSEPGMKLPRPPRP